MVTMFKVVRIFKYSEKESSFLHCLLLSSQQWTLIAMDLKPSQSFAMIVHQTQCCSFISRYLPLASLFTFSLSSFDSFIHVLFLKWMFFHPRSFFKMDVLPYNVPEIFFCHLSFHCQTLKACYILYVCVSMKYNQFFYPRIQNHQFDYLTEDHILH